MTRRVLVIGATAGLMGKLSGLLAQQHPDIILIDSEDANDFHQSDVDEAVIALHDYHRDRDMPDVRYVLPPVNTITREERKLALNQQRHRTFITTKRLNVRQRPVRRYDRSR